jgi:hypothetical protein
MPGAQCTRGLACERLQAHELVTTGSPKHHGIPCAMVFPVSFVLFPVTGLSCHRRLLGVLGPVGPTPPRCRLSASVGAPEPHDFAVRARTASSLRYSRVHRIPLHVS